jgi:pseudouridine synthase
MPDIRLQKIISGAGIASRREAERLIAEGRVSVNGRVITEPGTKADPSGDAIKVEGRLITSQEAPVYLALNKPKNVLTTMRDEEGKNRPTVADLIPPKRRRVFPIGRLDFDAEGVILLTNDGELAHRLAHPRYGIPRVYEAKVKGSPDGRALRRLERMTGGDEKSGPLAGRVRVMNRKAQRNTWLRIELREGQHHQVKKMCEATGHPVLKLVRRSFGGITTRGIPRAGIRTLSEEEVARLKAAVRSASGKKKTPAPKSASDQKSAGGKKSAAPKKSPGRKSPAKKSSPKKSPGRKSPGRKSPAKKSSPKQSPGRKSPGRKSPTGGAERAFKKRAAGKKRGNR